MGILQSVIAQMEQPIPMPQQQQQRFVVSPRQWVQQQRWGQRRPQHTRVQQLRLLPRHDGQWPRQRAS